MIIEQMKPLRKHAATALVNATDNLMETSPLMAINTNVAVKVAQANVKMLGACRSHSKCLEKTVVWSRTPAAKAMTKRMPSILRRQQRAFYVGV